MKTSILFIALSLALSVSAATQQNNRGGSRFQPNRGAGGNKGQQKNQNNGKNANQGTGAAGAAAGAGTAGAAAGAGSANTGKVLANGNGNANSTDTADNGANANNAGSGAGNDSDAQSSLTLDPKVLATGFEDDGQDVPTAGQVASLTSSNNFINFCLTVPNLPITNGKQITTGSCNPAPMGVIPSSDNMPSSKFIFPKNGDTSIKANTAFTIQMAVANFQTGAFVNAQENYFAAPQTVNAQGQIVGHSHVVVEPLTALDQTTPTDPKKFVFFKGLNDAAVNGVLTADVADGLPAGVYKLSSINTAANHQPVLVPIAQHGSLDDAVYFTITDDGDAAAGSGADSGAAANSTADASGADSGANGADASANDAASGADGAAANANDASANANGAAANGAAAGSAANASGAASSSKNGAASAKGGAAANKGQQEKGQQGKGKQQQQQKQKEQQRGGRRRRYAREFF